MGIQLEQRGALAVAHGYAAGIGLGKNVALYRYLQQGFVQLQLGRPDISQPGSRHQGQGQTIFAAVVHRAHISHVYHGNKGVLRIRRNLAEKTVLKYAVLLGPIGG